MAATGATERHPENPGDAEQLSDLVVRATELLHDASAGPEALDRFAEAVAGLRGVRAVTVLHPADPDADPPADTDPAGQPSTGDGPAMVVPLQILGRSTGVLVEFCTPRHEGWAGPRQDQRLRAALALIGSAADRMAQPHAEPEDLAKESDGPLSPLLRHSRSIIVRIGLDGEWSIVSDAVTPVLGYPRDVRLPGGLMSVIHPRDRYTAARALLEVRGGQHAARTDIRVRSADGRWRFMDTVFYDMTDVPGVHSVIAYAIDVTEHRAAERRSRTERMRLRALVMKLHAAVLVEDERGRTALANDTFAHTFGGESGRAWINADRSHALAVVAEACRDRETVHAQLTDLAHSRRRCLGYGLELANGRQLDLDFVPLREGEVNLGALWYFRDVTDVAATQHELKERNRVLTEAGALKNQFVASVAHELRTPLTAVNSFAEMLLDPGCGPLNGYQRAAADAVSRNAQRLMRLADDLLLHTQLERHALPIHLSTVDVSDLVHIAVADRAPDARRSGVTVTVEVADGPPMVADAARLHQVLGNLLGNAVKFTKPPGWVTVRARYEEPHWVIEVTDTGIGIPEAELQHITDTFARGSNALARRLSGSGLGLAISKQIVELHHGELEVESAVNKGTTVRVRLPLEQNEEEE